MKQEKYFCDKCNKEITHTRDTCANIELKLKFPEKYYAGYRNDACRVLELCWECIEKIGLKKIEDKQEKPKPPDIGDKLYEILCDLGVKFEQ